MELHLQYVLIKSCCICIGRLNRGISIYNRP
nr:MAG TPA: hypothetical protein [Caudoviricetes sp.]